MCNVWQQSKHFAFTYYSKFFASRFPEGFCPLYFAGVSLHLEVLVALWTAKSEDLQCIVNKLHIKINSINKFKLSLPLFIRELYESLRGLISVTSLSKLWLISVVVWIKSLRHNYRIPGPFSRYILVWVARRLAICWWATKPPDQATEPCIRIPVSFCKTLTLTDKKPLSLQATKIHTFPFLSHSIKPWLTSHWATKIIIIPLLVL